LRILTLTAEEIGSSTVAKTFEQFDFEAHPEICRKIVRHGNLEAPLAKVRGAESNNLMAAHVKSSPTPQWTRKKIVALCAAALFMVGGAALMLTGIGALISALLGIALFKLSLSTAIAFTVIGNQVMFGSFIGVGTLVTKAGMFSPTKKVSVDPKHNDFDDTLVDGMPISRSLIVS